MAQDFDFSKSLLVEAFSIAHNFERTEFFSFVVKYFDNFSKAALAQSFQDFLSLGYMIFRDHNVVSLVIIIAEIKFLGIAALNLFGLYANKINIFILLNF